MNANELANLLEVDSWYKLVTRKEIATMLRQQQAEIEALKKEAALQRLSDFTQEVEKTLTDEEILALAYEILETWNTKEALIDFARAILKKAQEK